VQGVAGIERVRRAMGGNADAFGELVAQYRDAVYGVCYHRVGRVEDAKDLAQEAFVRAYLSLPQLRDVEAFPAWLRRVAERVCATWQRRQRLQLMPLDGVAEPMSDRDLDLPLAIRQALARLTDDARLAITLYYVNGYTTGEVAEFLGVPAGTVKSRLHYARRRLKEELVDEYRDALKQSAPGPELEGAVVRAVRSLEEARSLPLAQRWGGPKSEEDVASYVVLVAKDGTIVGECYFSRSEVVVRGLALAVARDAFTSGESGCVNYWQADGLGVLDRLVPKALADAAERGLVLAAWHGELVPATRHGFVPCFYHHRITAPAQNLARGRARGRVRAYRKADANAVARLRAMERPRPTMWAWQGHGDAPDYVLERDGEVVGCYSLVPKHRKCPDTISLLNEMEGVDMAAYRAMARHCGRTALKHRVDVVTTYLSPEHPIGHHMLACGGVCQMQGASWNVAKDEELVCILDLAAALRAVAPGLGRIAKGRVAIQMDGQTATITAGEPPCVREGPAAGVKPSRIGRVPMTQLLVGYRSVFEIAGRDDVAIRDQDLALLDALFPKTRPYSWPDPYVWDENTLRADRPWAYEEPWRSRLAKHPRLWA